ncbi:hypothetical protein ACLOJK_018359, partial [Asimina triloba]
LGVDDEIDKQIWVATTRGVDSSPATTRPPSKARGTVPDESTVRDKTPSQRLTLRTKYL